MQRYRSLLALVPIAFLAACVQEGDEDEASAVAASELTSVSAFQNGVSPASSYAGTTDTTLAEATPTTADGSNATLQMDRDAPSGSHKSVDALLRFDLSSIPAGSTVSGARLTVNVTNATSGAGYLVYPAARAWTEATATWQSAASGTSWATPGARGAADRGTTTFGTLAPTATGKTTLALNAAGVAAVQAWVKTPGANFGFVIDAIDDMDGLAFDSSEAALVGNRPALVVDFTAPAPPPNPPPVSTSLDESGGTIPDTAYPVPTANVIFLATSGADTNNGQTTAAPVKTLARALALAPSGGTVVVRAGTYRDGNAATGKPVTIQAYPHEQVWFDGTDVFGTASWTSDGAGHWSMAWSTPTFCGGGYYNYKYDAQPTSNSGPCAHFDMYGDPAYPAAGDPQMVFIDGKYVAEVKTLAAATSGHFFYDWSARRIYIATNPSGHTVELAARPSALIMSGAGSRLLGIGFKRYATNEYANATGSAVYGAGANGVYENVVFKQMAGGALYASATGSRVSHSVFAANGYNGIGSNGHQHSTGAHDGLVIETSVFNGNNTEHFGPNCSASCGQAGVKIAHMDGFTIKNNIFENNVDAHGFWCDLACTNAVIVGNIARHNGRSGIIYEVSDSGIIASNLVYGNGAWGIRTCSSNTKIYNNTLVDNVPAGIWNYDDPRSFGVDGWTDVGPDTRNVAIVNNVISGSVTVLRTQGQKGAPNTSPEQQYAALDYNAYHRKGGATQGLEYWIGPTSTTTYTSLATFSAAKGLEKHTTDVVGGADPFFVDAAAGNYAIRTSSAAYHSGTALPADVAAAVGVTAGAAVSRGAIHWVSGP